MKALLAKLDFQHVALLLLAPAALAFLEAEMSGGSPFSKAGLAKAGAAAGFVLLAVLKQLVSSEPAAPQPPAAQ